MPWIERDVDWNDLSVEYCDVTGQLLPKRYWSFEVDGQEVRTVDPRYERLYLEYVRPRQASGDAVT
jgi:hypothetical protein